MPAQLRFSDVDRFGHVNNSVYFSLFDMCKTRYFNDVVGTDIFDRMAPVVVHIEANFISPVYFPDEIVIDTSIVKIGNKSFTVTNESVEIDSEFRTKVSSYERL